jgi:methionyl-tRNA formyltransferase
MRLVFLGTPQFAVPSLNKLLAQPDFDVVAVVTQPDKRRGRGKQEEPSPIKKVALEANCPVLQPRRIKKDEAVLSHLESLAADAFVVVAYGQILSQRILDMPRLGCINGHGSLLPAYRGAAPIQWCIVNGETETGMTTMQMDIGMDTGDMLLKSHLPIGLLDNFYGVAADLADQCADLLVATLHRLEAGTLTPKPQDEALATYAPLIKKEDYELDWGKPAIALHNQIRGFYPNCVTRFREQLLKIIATVPVGDPFWQQLPPELAQVKTTIEAIALKVPDARPGTVLGFVKGLGPVVQTGDGLILLKEVKPTGKKAQSGWDFVNGSRLEAGELLG